MQRLALVVALAAIGLALLPAVAASSPQKEDSHNAVLYGTVYDRTGQPMPGVTLTFENSGLRFAQSTITDADGSWSFEAPAGSGYRITALKDGKVIASRGAISLQPGSETVFVPPLVEGEATAKPLQFTEVEQALEGAVPISRIIAMVRRFGVDFRLSDERENQLRELGADDKLIIAILKGKK